MVSFFYISLLWIAGGNCPAIRGNPISPSTSFDRDILKRVTMEEIWKDVKGYEGFYQVSSFGRLRRVSQESWRKTRRSPEYRYIKGSTSSKTTMGKYALVWLKDKRVSLHRLVASHFIDNPESREQINHIDGDPQNNRVDNLEWCTASENARHSIDVLGYKQSTQTRIKRAKKLFKKVIDHNGNIIYESVRQYAAINGLRYNTVVRKLNGYTKNDLNISYAEAR